MAFDLAPFDLSGFDVGGSSTVLFSLFVQEKVLAVIGTSQEVYINASTYERANTLGASCGNGIFLQPVFTEEASFAEGHGEFSVILNTISSTETMHSYEVTCDSEVHLDVSSSEEVFSDEMVPNAEICLKINIGDGIIGEAYTDKNRWITFDAYELMSSSATLEAVDIITCELNVRLEPGQRLVVDAENYNVLIDGENAIEIQRGEWIDELNRETSSISVTAASGVSNLSASILYTERYL